jgi:carboxymethylenebutenolidase
MRRGRGRAGSDIELAIDAGGSASKAAAYHAVPAAGRGRAVLVLDETAALSDFARDACDRLARAGFAALAPDLSTGEDIARVVDAGVRQLLDDAATDGSRVGALGFGRGGALALLAAARNRRIGGVVDCYGVPDADSLQEVAPVETPALLIFGEEDSRVREGGVRELEASLGSARLSLGVGAGEGFMNEARADLFAATAAAAGWDATIAFLGATL